ncbi:exodeoxyribonuclease X [Candidatus Sodalis endolongispinus]|uniref:Exodeoxyribonuclease X n=1 Tax=Candidatus Sodalis endolongispinus TaxID=2812662 RepID=A0ABS5YE63_9GAMM|nr:exodeoxyribonuclease X [Candidatus Sodalis endolongispinus]MBT9433007.1 exodeoxyribonuclease X [Candidatus Sodalis endolongispinus]
MTFRVIDTETCCLDAGVVEIASLDLSETGISNVMSDLVNPGRPIGLDAMAIHHITEEMVADKPRIARVIGRYQGSAYYVAHNAAFDGRMLPEMNGAWICTLKLARKLYPGIKYGNQYLRYALNLQVTPPAGLYPHRALYDFYVTAALLMKIQQDSGWSAEEMVAISNEATLLSSLKFGKYRGQPLAQIALQDPDYLHWLLANLRDLSADLRYSLNFYPNGADSAEQTHAASPAGE